MRFPQEPENEVGRGVKLKRALLEPFRILKVRSGRIMGVYDNPPQTAIRKHKVQLQIVCLQMD